MERVQRCMQSAEAFLMNPVANVERICFHPPHIYDIIEVHFLDVIFMTFTLLLRSAFHAINCELCMHLSIWGIDVQCAPLKLTLTHFDSFTFHSHFDGHHRTKFMDK